MFSISEDSKFIRRKIFTNKTVKFFSCFSVWLITVLFFILIIFIILKSIPGFKHYGFSGIFLTDKYSTSTTDQYASVWLPMAITLIITLGALLIATPLGVKSATFIYFRIKNKSFKKALKIIIEISAAIPSVVFGLFAYKSLGDIVKNVFHLEIANSVLTAILMLSIMLIPTIVLLTLNAYSSVDNNVITNSISLANYKTKAIYKTFRLQTRKQIIVAIIISASRVIGETMAVSMILSSENYNTVFSGGFINILISPLRPLGAVIAKGMFAENGGESFRGLLFAFGLIMFVIVIILNSFVMIASNIKVRKKFKCINSFLNGLGNYLLIIPNQISFLFNRIFYSQKVLLTKDNYQENTSKYIQERIEKNKNMQIYSIYKMFWEYISIAIVLFFIFWIVLDVALRGLYACSLPTSTVFQYSADTTGQAVINTLLLIIVTIVISLPLSLLIAIWLNEYAKNNIIKKVIVFFLDSIGATPSILFGMFGLAFFIQILHLSYGGAMGNSLIAGALTMVIVIMPTFTRMNQQALQAVPKEIRENSYVLGNSKWYTIRTLVLPHASKTILSSITITIGRILAETAPLYLTAGLSSASTIALMNPSQTLTTRIYAQLSGNDNIRSLNIMYESALIALILIMFLVIISYLIIPNWSNIKKTINEWWTIKRLLWKQKKIKIKIDKYKTQIYNNTLYLTTEQASKLKVDNSFILLYKDNYLKVNIISTDQMMEMEKNYLLINNKILK